MKPLDWESGRLHTGADYPRHHPGERRLCKQAAERQHLDGGAGESAARCRVRHDALAGLLAMLLCAGVLRRSGDRRLCTIERQMLFVTCSQLTVL